MEYYGTQFLEKQDIPKCFFRKNTFSHEQMYNIIKQYMVRKYGKQIEKNYRWCAEADQLHSIMMKRNTTVKRYDEIFEIEL